MMSHWYLLVIKARTGHFLLHEHLLLILEKHGRIARLFCAHIERRNLRIGKQGGIRVRSIHAQHFIQLVIIVEVALKLIIHLHVEVCVSHHIGGHFSPHAHTNVSHSHIRLEVGEVLIRIRSWKVHGSH